MVKDILAVAGAVAVSALVGSVAQAASITGDWNTSFRVYVERDITQGTAFKGTYEYPGGVKTAILEPDVFTPGVTQVSDWAAFCLTSVDFENLDYVTRSANDSLTGQISGVSNVNYAAQSGGRLKYHVTGGVGNPTDFHGDANNPKTAASGSMSFTTKLYSSDETLAIYVYADGNGGYAVNLDASLDSGTSFSVTGTHPVALWDNNPLQPLNYGIFMLHVTGNVGDTLTFTATEPTGSQYSGVGISAVQIITAVPEPATLGMLGGAGLLLVRRRRVA